MLCKKNIYLGLFIFIFGISSVAMINATEKVVSQQDVVAAVTLEGTVTDSQTDIALAGIEVELVEIDQKATTDENGKYIFTDLTEGETYMLKVEEDGFEDFKETIEATAETPTIEVDIALDAEME
ncbi:MAG: carboxypeptidase-like regulatory domain-containing protein [Balneolaceae bacterium]